MSDSTPRLKPERIDDGARSPHLEAVIDDLEEMGLFAHVPNDDEIARTRAMLENRWTIARELTLPNLEAVQLFLTVLNWIASRESAVPAKPVDVLVTFALSEKPASEMPASGAEAP